MMSKNKRLHPMDVESVGKIMPALAAAPSMTDQELGQEISNQNRNPSPSQVVTEQPLDIIRSSSVTPEIRNSNHWPLVGSLDFRNSDFWPFGLNRVSSHSWSALN